MAFKYTNKKGTDYYLNKTTVKLKGSGKVQDIYYFTKKPTGKGLDEVPSGYKVLEVQKTGLPVLKKK